MYKIVNNRFYITRGDSAENITLGITDRDGTAYNPKSDDIILFTVKADTVTSAHLIQKEIKNGVFDLAPVDTEALAYGDYVYDVQLKMGSGYTDTIIGPCFFRVCPEVTF